jgi:hypothetical protein
MIICKNLWNQISQYGLEGILPDDDIIQKYMSYLDGKLTDNYVFSEIEKYRRRLEIKLNDSNNKEFERLFAAVNDYENKLNFLERSNFHYNRNITEKNLPFL